MRNHLACWGGRGKVNLSYQFLKLSDLEEGGGEKGRGCAIHREYFCFPLPAWRHLWGKKKEKERRVKPFETLIGGLSIIFTQSHYKTERPQQKKKRGGRVSLVNRSSCQPPQKRKERRKKRCFCAGRRTLSLFSCS